MAPIEPIPFALAACGCPPHAELAVSLAGALGRVDSTSLDNALEALAATIPIPDSPRPENELRAVAELWEAGVLPGPLDDEWPVALTDLLIDRSLPARSAHPLLQAVIAVEAGRRCGFALGVVSNGDEHCVAHTRLDEPLVILAPAGDLIDGRTLPPTLTWRCAHEACALLIDEIEARLLRVGNVSDAMIAAELRMHLPVDEHGQEVALQKRASVQALLN